MKKIDLSPSSIGTGVKPFMDEAYEKGIIQDGDIYHVVKVKESNGKSGWSIHTEKFILFVFKSSPICEVIMEVMQELVATNPAPALLMEIDSSEANGFNLGLSEEKSWMWTRSKKLGSSVVIARQPSGSGTTDKKRVNGK